MAGLHVLKTGLVLVQTNIAASTLPDVQMISGLGFVDHVLKGAFLALDDYIASFGLDMSDVFSY